MPDLPEMERVAHRFDTIVLAPQKHGVPTFVCPMCGNKARNDAARMQPMCTGPHPSLDEHEPTVMVRTG